MYNKILILDKPNIDKNKLFAIIFYKNIFPDDFARIQKNDSRLHRVFKKDFKNDKDLKAIILEIDNKVKEETEKKDNFQKELNDNIIRDVNELRKIYIFHLLVMISEKEGVKINEIENIKLSATWSSEENFEKIKESNNIKYSSDYYSNQSSYISFSEVENNVNLDVRYNKREKIIKDFHENKIALLERKILHLNNEKQNIKNLSLLELCENYNEGIDNFLDSVYSEINENYNKATKLNSNISLFKYLFKNDYLNEDFIEYISYFHPGSLSPNDHNLMMKINQNERTSFDEKIEDVENLVKSIRDIRFKNKSILICDILQFLLKDCQNPNLRSEKLDFVLDQIKNYNDQSVYFIEKFLKKISYDNTALSDFYVEITKWDKFWNLVETKFSQDLKRIILFDLIQLFSDDTGDLILIKLNKNKGLTNFISSDKDLLIDIFERINPDSFIKTLKVLQVQFNSITYSEKIRELLFKVYENSLYQITKKNLYLFSHLDEKYNHDPKQFLKSNLGFLKSKEESFLYKRINENLNQYVENVYLKIETNINEKPDEVLYLLEQNDEIVSLENKLQIIKQGFEGKLENYGKILSKDIIIFLVKENKILSSWKNIIAYYNQEGSLTLILTNFLNIEENYSRLSITQLHENFTSFFKDKRTCIDFIYTLINDENLLEDSFEEIFKESGKISLEANEVILESRIFFLIDKNFIILDEEEFESLSEKNIDFLIRLIEKNEENFISDLNVYSFDIEFLENLFESKLSVQSLHAIIIEREIDIIENENLDFLQKISKFYIKNPSLNFTSEIFEKLITSDLEEEYKIGLFNLVASDERNEYDISDLLEKMGERFANIIENEELSFKINKKNEEFLNILKKNELIKGFRRDNKKEVFNISYS